jgi:hypothetical protein
LLLSINKTYLSKYKEYRTQPRFIVEKDKNLTTSQI